MGLGKGGCQHLALHRSLQTFNISSLKNCHTSHLLPEFWEEQVLTQHVSNQSPDWQEPDSEIT